MLAKYLSSYQKEGKAFVIGASEPVIVIVGLYFGLKLKFILLLSLPA